MYHEINFDKINIDLAPPVEEPARQYYFLKKCRALVEELSARAGRPLTASTVTFGCQMNLATMMA